MSLSVPPLCRSSSTVPTDPPRNLWAGRIAALEPHGEGVRVEIAEAPDPKSSILAEITPSAVADLELLPGSPVWAAVKASDIEVYSDLELPRNALCLLVPLAASAGPPFVGSGGTEERVRHLRRSASANIEESRPSSLAGGDGGVLSSASDETARDFPRDARAARQNRVRGSP